MDHGDRNLTQPLVRYAKDRHFGDVRTCVAFRLDFGRGDILTAADDDLLLAVDDEQIAVFVEITDVARAHVSVGREQCSGGLRITPVSFDARGAADRDLADLSSAQVPVAFSEDRKLD